MGAVRHPKSEYQMTKTSSRHAFGIFDFEHLNLFRISNFEFRASAAESGFTLVEVILTILIVGVGLVASFRTLPVILQVSDAARKSIVAQRLATDLLAEIAMLPFEDPDGSPVFGPEDDEETDTRADFDDIDDYDDWSASPPQKKDGREETDCAEYQRSVTVVYVDVSDFDTIIAEETTSDAKRITITVSRQKTPPVVVTTVRLKGANREDLD